MDRQELDRLVARLRSGRLRGGVLLVEPLLQEPREPPEGELLGAGQITRLVDELEESDRAIRGEAGFLLAELSLTLARVDWTSTARILPLDIVQEEARSVLAEVKKLAKKAKVEDPALRSYVRRALAEARL